MRAGSSWAVPVPGGESERKEMHVIPHYTFPSPRHTLSGAIINNMPVLLNNVMTDKNNKHLD